MLWATSSVWPDASLTMNLWCLLPLLSSGSSLVTVPSPETWRSLLRLVKASAKTASGDNVAAPDVAEAVRAPP